MFDRALRQLSIAAAFSAVATAALAQPAASYPNKPIHLIVGFAPGGGTDITARLIGAEITAATGQQVIVENRPGAANNIAVDAVAHAAPDGYTLLLSNATSAINQTLYRNLKFDFKKDFVHIARVAEGGFTLVVPLASPANNPKELAAMLQRSPDKYSYASSGIGTSVHATGAMFAMATKANVAHIPYRGSALGLTGLMSGETAYMFDNTALELVKSNKLKALAVTSRNRSALLPNVPTMIESGFPDFVSTWWYGISAPAGTPAPIVDKLNKLIMAAMTKPNVRETLMKMGDVSSPNTSNEYTQFVYNDVARWKKVIDEAHITTD
jgi:tripartite-type tricarboxylate transporter receptor subunit TctC